MNCGQKSAIVVPFSEHLAAFRFLKEFFKAALKQTWIFLFYLNRVDSHLPIKRRKGIEVSPNFLVRFQCAKNFIVNRKARRRHIGQHGASSVGHKSKPLKAAASLFIKFRPKAVFPARRKTLRGDSALKFFRSAVDPAETKSLFHRVDVPKCAVVLRPPALYHDPAFAFRGVMRFEPFAKFTAIFRGQKIFCLHFHSDKIISRNFSARKNPAISKIPSSKASPCRCQFYFPT